MHTLPGATRRHRPAAPDPRVLYCARTGAAVSNDAIWYRDKEVHFRWLVETLDINLQRAPAIPAFTDDFGNLVLMPACSGVVS